MGLRGHTVATAKRSMSEWNGINLRYTHKSDVGQVRENNQDSLLVEPSLGLFVIADGMGGRAGGEVASLIAVETLKSEVSARFKDLYFSDQVSRETIMRQAINQASLQIYSRSLELPHLKGMGTTTTALWLPVQSGPQMKSDLSTQKAMVAHVGDSRCYLLRAGLMYQLTHDHSLFQEKVKAGLLTADSLAAAQLKSVITRCVGYQEDEEVDVFSFRPFHGDRFLMCSDGLSNKISEREMADLMMEDDLEWVCEHVVELSKERGGEDNITVILIALDS
jgi:protein phosphatase